MTTIAGEMPFGARFAAMPRYDLQPVPAARARGTMTDLTANLTDGQRDCLRLVYRHMTSKDIARALDISPHTVDMRLRTAMRTLAVASRIDAARLLIDSEAKTSVYAPDTYQPLIYQASDVASAAPPATSAASASTASDDHASQQSNTRFSPEVGPPAGGPPRPAGASTLYNDRPVSTAGDYQTALGQSLPWGRRNTLTPGARLAWMATIAIGSALGFGAILGALEALKNLL